MFKVSNMISNRTGREIPNQFIIENGNITAFQSYKSPIIEIDYSVNEIRVFPHYDYSRTTSKYRNQFLDEMGFYGLANRADLETAIKTGEYSRGYGIVWRVISCEY